MRAGPTALTVAHLAGDEDDQAQFAGLMATMLEIEDLPTEQRDAAWDAWDARDAAWAASIIRILEWLGDYADGWEDA